jgi:serine/threonine kinase 3
MPPEVLAGDPYSFSADVWSLGITILEMCEGKPPRADTHAMRAMFEIATKPPPTFQEPSKWTTEFKAFLAACLHKDAAERSTAEQLSNHPFLQSHLAVSLSILCLEYQAKRKRLNKLRAQQKKVVMHLLSLQSDSPADADANLSSSSSTGLQVGPSDDTLNMTIATSTATANTTTSSTASTSETAQSNSDSSAPSATDSSTNSSIAQTGTATKDPRLRRYTTAELDLDMAPEEDEDPLDQAHYRCVCVCS